MSRIQLGQAFSIRPKSRALVNFGIYRKIRHPMYLFSALFLLGMILYSQIWAFLLIFLILGPIQVYRSRLEDRRLQSTFGQEYRDYRNTTWF